MSLMHILSVLTIGPGFGVASSTGEDEIGKRRTYSSGLDTCEVPPSRAREGAAPTNHIEVLPAKQPDQEE
jgi:hypothetical protein